MSSTLIFTNLVVGPLLLVFALIFKMYPPKKINHIYGYRTKRSMKSQEAWDASNKYGNDLMLWTAIITVVSQIILYLVFDPTTALLTACVIMCILLVVMVFVVENYLKKNFNSNGEWKT
ncbi:SdpI family protein [Ekhidna sp.]